ncbi:MAG: peptidoglycan DD-metalloendopeptidase family protein [Patescibacteria group bacterium]
MLLIAHSAEAGIASFVEDLFELRAVYSAAAIQPNSQTIELVEGPLNAGHSRARGGGEATIVEDSAILADISPAYGGALDESASDEISVYVVRTGDTLSEIADMFNVSVNTILWANDLRRSDLVPAGQTLVILPISGVQHRVISGDTIASIAKKYHADAVEITDFNGLIVGQTLMVGEIVMVPDGELIIDVPVGKPAPGGGGKKYAGYYLRPISGGVKTQGLHGYNGVDLATYLGAPIYAAADGEVVISKSSGWNGGYGQYVVIRHANGTQTLYAHNSRNLVRVGQKVTRGQAIAQIGSTGKSTGPHIHFEVRGAANPF